MFLKGKQRFTCLSIYIIISLALFSVLTNSLNTHQNLTNREPPKLFKLNVTKGDNVRVNVFDSNGQVTIVFQDLKQSILQQNVAYCFQDDICSFQFIPQSTMQTQVFISVENYSYNYQIFINSKSVKKVSSTNSFINGAFFYSKYLKAGTYSFTVYFKDKIVPSINLLFMNKNFQIKNNIPKFINFTLEASVPLYSIQFNNSPNNTLYFLQHPMNVLVTLPNNMLKGCNGNNVYDQKIRRCPSKTKEIDDSIRIHKIGYYPSFQIKQPQKNTFKITFIEMLKYKQLLEGNNLTIFLANSSNPQIFNNLTKKQIISKFRTKADCLIKGPVCTFNFRLEPGNYTVMPMFSDEGQFSPLVYLFERSDGKTVLDIFYSMFSVLQPQNQKYYFTSVLLQFQSLNQAVTQIQVISDQNFILNDYNIYQRSRKANKDGEFDMGMAQYGNDNV